MELNYFLQRNPLLIWTTAFIAGIALGLNFHSSVFILLVAGGIFTLFVWLKFKKNGLERFLFLLLFILFGYLSSESIFAIKNEKLEHQKDTQAVVYLHSILSEKNTWNTVLGEVKNTSGESKDSKVDERIMLIVENGGDSLTEESTILANVSLKQVANKNNPGEFNPEYYWKSKGVRFMSFVGATDYLVVQKETKSWFTKFLEATRNYSSQVIEEFVEEEQQGLLKAMLLGNKSDLDISDKNLFASVGAMHVLAVSGLHVGIIAYLLSFIVKQFFAKRGRVIGTLLIVLALWFYAFLTGLSPSVTRAVFMFSILLLGKALSREYQPVNTLFFVALVLLIINPLSLLDIGFQLSFSAMLGIFLLYPIIEKMVFTKHWILTKLWQGVAVSIAAQLMTAPLTLYYFHQFPNYFLLSNVVVLIFAGIVLALGVILLVVGTIPGVNWLAGLLVSKSLAFMVFLLSLVASLPFGVATGFSYPWYGIIIGYGAIFLLFYALQKKKVLLVTVVALLPIALLQFGRLKNLNKSEVCIFNASSQVILFKKNNKAICLFRDTENGKRKAEWLLRDYVKIHPCSVKYVAMGRENVVAKIAESSIEVDFAKTANRLKLPSGKTLDLVFSKKYKAKNEINTVGLPYLDDFSAIDYCLKDGAYRVQI